MADAFSDALVRLVTDCPGVQGAAFTDLDGEEIAIHPRQKRDELRLCAAYGGIAMRRLSHASTRSGRGAMKALVLHGARGTVLTMRVGDDYQLVVSVIGPTPAARVLVAAKAAKAAIEDSL